jgi:hypothetical protein
MINGSIINIAGLTYTINIKSSYAMDGAIGLADFNRQEISINAAMTPQTQKIALYHEILHLLDSVYHLKFTEEQVTYTAHALVALVADNIDSNLLL